MSTAITSFTVDALPNTPWNGDVSDLLNLLADHMTAELPGDVFVGQDGGTEPTTDIGIWLNNNTWSRWSTLDGRYLPFPVVAGAIYNDTLYTTLLKSGAQSADITLNLPDEDGQTIATLKDVFTPNPTETVTGGAIVLDWSLKTRYYGVLTSNATITDTGSPIDGDQMQVWLENNATAYTVTWPATWYPAGGTAPTQTTAAAGHRRIDHYKIYKVGAFIFYEFVQAFDVLLAGGDTAAPTVSQIQMTSGTALMYIVFNELLRGATLSVSDFTVRINGVVNTVLSASSSGNRVTLQITSTVTTADTVTVQYSGATIKDSAGNAAAIFGPSAVSVQGTQTGGGFHGGVGGYGGGGYLPF